MNAAPAMDSRRKPDKAKKDAQNKTWLSSALGYSHFLPGFFVGVLVGLMVDLPMGIKGLHGKEHVKEKKRPGEVRGGARRGVKAAASTRTSNTHSAPTEGGELKMVLVVRTDLKMGSGKIASQCAHAAVGTFEECLSRGQRYLLKKWEDCGQPKIVVTCNNQNEMNELRAKAERIGLPVFTVADAGRTQVAAGSNTVLAIGPVMLSSLFWESFAKHVEGWLKLRLFQNWKQSRVYLWGENDCGFHYSTSETSLTSCSLLDGSVLKALPDG